MITVVGNCFSLQPANPGRLHLLDQVPIGFRINLQSKGVTSETGYALEFQFKTRELTH